MMRFSLVFKILATVCLIIVAVGAATSTIVFFRTKESFLLLQKDYVTKMVTEQMHETSLVLDRSKLFVEMVAVRTRVSEYLENPTKARGKELQMIFDNYQKDYPENLALYLLDATGSARISTDRSFLDKNYSFRDYYKQAIIGQSHMEAQVGVTSNQLGYYFSSPVYSLDHSKVIGVVVVKIKEDTISRDLSQSEVSKVGKVMLVSGQGRIYYSQKPQRQLSTLEEIGYGTVYNRVKNYTGNIVAVNFYDESDRENELVLVTKIKNTPYFLLVEMNDDDLEAAVMEVAGSIGVGVFLAALFALLIISLILLRLMSPISKISHFARQFGAGDFTQRIEIKSSDEIGQLADLLNQMAKNLQEAYSLMEQKIKERTADLERTKMAMLNVVEDVIEEKQNMVKFQKAVAGSSDHIVITDADGIILYANSSVERITGFSLSEIVGKKVGSRENWGGQMPADFYRDLWETIKIKKQPFAGQLKNRRKGGDIYDVYASISPIMDSNGNVQFFVGIERDITKEKEVDQAKTEFVSLASHQLRTPLSSINWYTEMLLSGDGGPINSEQKTFLEEIYGASQRMVELVNSLLNVSRLELGTFVIEPKPTDITELIKSIIDEQRADFVRRELAVVSNLESFPLINLDPNLFRMVVGNLLSNAIKYSVSKGKIVVETEKESGGFLVTVQDDGMGIPVREQDKMFTKLFRASNARNSDTSGTGLGLYVAKMVMDQSGGKIWFESEEGKGTKFFVWLPDTGMKAKSGTKQLET